MEELRNRLTDLQEKLASVREKLNIPDKKRQIKELEFASMQPDFWGEEQKARKVMQELAQLKEDVGQVERLEKEAGEQLELLALSSEEGTETLLQDIETTLENLTRDYVALEITLFLSGRYDRGNAIVSIHAGQGGTEAMDWAAMLFRMYTRYVEQMGWKYTLIDESAGEEAGIKEATLLVEGNLAYGYLKREQGTHRLVRQSPFNADNLRQTSFALVEVMPEVADSADITVKDEELEWQFTRAGGHGGQNVNKVNTAVRLRHIPSGIVVAARTERYQEQNRKLAMALLTAKLWQVQEAKREEELAKLKGQKMASWGTQIRNYVLHPYQLVKDVRTGVETSDTEGVLDGKLHAFVEAEIKLASS